MTYKSLLVVAWKCGSAVGGEEGKKALDYTLNILWKYIAILGNHDTTATAYL